MATATPGATISFFPGTYSFALGTVYVLNKPLRIIGAPATLVNVRFIAQANLTLSGLNFIEQDCTYTSSNPSACPVASPILSVGAPGYTITQASISNVTMQYTRAYTGIAVGGGPTRNVSISGFAFSDRPLSGITLLNGSNIVISNGSITGGNDANVDDGIALDSAAGKLSNVTISNISATNTFDAVGIGAHLYYPLHDIIVNNTQCQKTRCACISKQEIRHPSPPSTPATPSWIASTLPA